MPACGWGNLPGSASLAGFNRAFLIVLVVGAIASYNINIDRFSLHAVYRNRLIRAFLGASSRKRDPNPFTGFDPGDNPRVRELWPIGVGAGTQPGPIPLIGDRSMSSIWRSTSSHPDGLHGRSVRRSHSRSVRFTPAVRARHFARVRNTAIRVRPKESRSGRRWPSRVQQQAPIWAITPRQRLRFSWHFSTFGSARPW